MPTQPYHVKDGTRVPGTTTIISNCKMGGIEPLLFWANRLGKEGKSHREVRDEAAEAGTIAHAMVEDFIRGRDPFKQVEYVPEDIEKKARGAFASFQEWARQTKLEVAESELPLVSEEYRYGGTMDAMLMNGDLALGDWKTSNGVYPDYICQLAAYRQLWRENFPARPVTGGVHLLRFGKEYGDFHHHFWPEAIVDMAWETFKHMRAIYDLHKELKKVA